MASGRDLEEKKSRSISIYEIIKPKRSDFTDYFDDALEHNNSSMLSRIFNNAKPSLGVVKGLGKFLTNFKESTADLNLEKLDNIMASYPKESPFDQYGQFKPWFVDLLDGNIKLQAKLLILIREMFWLSTNVIQNAYDGTINAELEKFCGQNPKSKNPRITDALAKWPQEEVIHHLIGASLWCINSGVAEVKEVREVKQLENVKHLKKEKQLNAEKEKFLILIRIVSYLAQQQMKMHMIFYQKLKEVREANKLCSPSERIIYSGMLVTLRQTPCKEFNFEMTYLQLLLGLNKLHAKLPTLVGSFSYNNINDCFQALSAKIEKCFRDRILEPTLLQIINKTINTINALIDDPNNNDILRDLKSIDLSYYVPIKKEESKNILNSLSSLFFSGSESKELGAAAQAENPTLDKLVARLIETIEEAEKLNLHSLKV